MRAEILMHQVHEPEGWVHWTSITIEAQIKYTIVNLIHTRRKNKMKTYSFMIKQLSLVYLPFTELISYSLIPTFAANNKDLPFCWIYTTVKYQPVVIWVGKLPVIYHGKKGDTKILKKQKQKQKQIKQNTNLKRLEMFFFVINCKSQDIHTIFCLPSFQFLIR